MAFGSVNVLGDLSYKQNKLTGTPGQVVGFGADGTAMAVNRWSNQNLLINSDFRRPVNRNGKREYTTAGYTIDRWRILDAVLQLTEDGIHIAPTAYNNTFTQKIENWNELVGKTVTLSFLCKNVTGTWTVASYNTPLSTFTTDGLVVITFTIPEGTPDINHFIGLAANAGAGIDLVAAKLELGGHQTLARQNEDGEWELIDPPDYDLQYALCSQYSPITGEWVGSQHSNPNLLDNWYFADPINQRGQTEYTGAVYTIDRWFNGHSELITRVEDDCISCTGTGLNLQQIISSNLAGQTVCMSVLCAGNINLVIGYLRNGEYQYPVMVSMNQENIGLLTLTYDIPSDVTQTVIYLQTVSGTARYYAAKVELGPVQTLAHKEGDTWLLNDPPPNKALELLKCQRYQVVFKQRDQSLGYSNLFFGTATLDVLDANNKYNGQGYIVLPTPMRIVPTISAGTLKFYNTIYNIQVESLDGVQTQSGATFRFNFITQERFDPLTAAITEHTGIIWSDTDVILDANL